MKKKIAVGLIFIFIVFAGWYLFLKPGDYQVTFTAKTFPGAINQTIKVWGKENFSGKIIEQKDLSNLRQQFQFGDSIIEYQWKITPLTDSTSKVRVRITDTKNSIKNRLQIPFSNTSIEASSKKKLLGYTSFLNNHIKKFRVTLAGEDELKAGFCAYLPAKGIQSEKAFAMMRDFPYLAGFVKEGGLTPDGTPFVEITEWNTDTDAISFNFCYPIVQTDSLPKHHEIKYKAYPKRRALKAIYNGNYMTSDRAWYKILTFAKEQGIEIDTNPIEIFYNNPTLGGDELKWKAEIFMPIKEPDE